MMYLYTILFYFTLGLGTFIAITANSWLITWTGLEINLMSLMPLMSQLNNKNSSESTIKYFIVQAMASTVFIFGSIIYSMTGQTNFIMMESVNSMLIFMAIMLKIGMVPFHFWLPEIITGSTWKMTLVILTWQKLAPMIIMYNILPSIMMMMIIILVSSMISGIQGLNQTCLKKILAYSSINHSSWMLSAMMMSLSMWMCYFLIYTLINFNIIYLMKKTNAKNIKQLSNLLTDNKMLKISFMVNFLSLGGLPPFIGFLPKWLVIMNLTEMNLNLLSISLIIFTLISLFFYIRIIMTSLSMNTEEPMFTNKLKINYYPTMLNTVLVLSLLFCTWLTNYL